MVESLSSFLQRNETETQQQKVGAAQLVLGSIETSPDDFAGDLRLAQDYGKATGAPVPPVEMVKDYRSTLMQKIEERKNQTILSTSPRLTDWLQDTKNASLAKDTLPELSWWEGLGKQVKETGKAVPGGALNSAGLGMEGAGQLMSPDNNGETLDLKTRISQAQSKTPEEIAALRQEIFQQGGINPSYAQSILSDVLDGSLRPEDAMEAFAPALKEVATALQQSGAAVQDYSATVLPAEKGMEDSVGRQVGSGLGSLLTILGVGLATGGVGAAAFGGASGAGEAAARARKAGQDEDTQTLAAVWGVLPGMTDAIPIERILANPVLKTGMAHFFRSIGKQALIEGGQEAVQQVLQNLIAKSLYEPQGNVMKDVADNFATGGLVGGLVDAARMAVSAALPGRIRGGQAAASQAPATAETIAEVSQNAQGSVLRERSPDTFRQYVEQATGGEPVENIFVPADKFVEYFQGIGVDPFSLIDEIDGLSRSDLDAALESADLKIPTAAYAAKLAGTEYDQFFQENGRFSPDGMSMTEAQEFEVVKNDLMQEAWDEAENARVEDEMMRPVEDQIRDELISRLRVEGRGTDEAQTIAQVITDHYRVTAAEQGITTSEYLARYPLPQFRGSIPQGMQPKNVDEFSRTLAEARMRKPVAPKTAPSLLEFISEYGGIANDRGELRARNAEVIKRGKGKKALRLRRSTLKDGMGSLFGSDGGKKYGADDVALAAVDAGFMADNPVVQEYKAAMQEGRETPDLTRALWEEIDNELRDGPRPAADASGSGDYLDEIESYLDSLGVSLSNDDATIRAAVEADQASEGRKYAQAAYHGTPHLFEKFSTSHIGAGEGTQFEGWGLYFASKKEIAEWYKAQLSAAVTDPSGVNQSTLDRTGLSEIIPETLSDQQYSQLVDRFGEDDLLEAFEDAAVSAKGGSVEKAISDGGVRGAVLQAMKDAGWKFGSKGHLYEVDIPGPDDVLNWELPLSEQPEAVKAGLAEVIDLYKSFTPKSNALDGDMRFAQFYKLASSEPYGTPEQLSRDLAAAGIPGHRYLDAASRKEGDGTYNYVIYDDSRVSVTQYYQDASNGPRGSIAFPTAGIGKGDTIIRTFETANLSTILHELGHMFLTMTQADAARGIPTAIAKMDAAKAWWRSNASDVAKDAMRVMPDVTVTAADVEMAIDAGTTGDVMKDAAIDIGMQEQTARGFEAYLFEGKAPSAGMRDLFARMSAWLVRVYRRVTALDVKLDDKIRSVFDRMLATEDEIAAAQRDLYSEHPLFASAEEMGLTQEQYQKLMDVRRDAENQAKTRLLAKVMEPEKRAREAWFKEERAKVRAEVEAEFKQSRTYRSIQEIRFGKNFDGDEVQALKMSREVIEREFGAGYIPFLPGTTKDGHGHKNAVFTNDGGVHPDIAAGAYGFRSGSEMLDAMTQAPAMDEAIEAETDKTMRERHGDVMNDGTLEAEAMDAVHNDKRGEAIAIEYKAVIDVAGTGIGLTLKEARAAARTAAGRMAVRDATNASRFLAAERKAGAEAARLGAMLAREGIWMRNARRRIAVNARQAIKGEASPAAVAPQIEAANTSTESYNDTVSRLIKAKRRQLMNHALYMEARQISEKVDKTATKLSKLGRANSRQVKTRNLDHVMAARAIAARFGLARPDTQFDFDAWIAQLQEDDPGMAAAMGQAITTYANAPVKYRDLTVDQFNAISDAIENILETGKRYKMLEIEGQTVERDAAISELTAVLEARGSKPNEALKARLTDAQKNGRSALSMLSALRRMENWARDMDDGEQGVFTRYLVRPVMQSVDIYRSKKAETLTDLLAVINPRKDDLLGGVIDAPELGYTFQNKGELLHAILHTGNDSNKEKLLIGRGWSDGLTGQEQAASPTGKPRMDKQGNPIMTRGSVDTSRWDAFISRMISQGKITKADYDTAQAIWDLNEKLKRPAQSAHRKMFGYYFDEVEASPVETPFGTYRGGYVPAIADTDASNDGQLRADQAAMEAQQTSFMFPTTGKGFTKARVQNYHTPLALNLMLLPAHMDKVLRFTHIEPTIRQTASLVTNREMRGALDAFDRTIAPNLITPWLQRTAQQAVETQPSTPAGRAFSAVVRGFRTRVGVHTMFANLVNTAQQVTGFASAAILVKPTNLKKALVSFSMGNASDMRATASEKSGFMRDRIEMVGRETQRRIQDIITEPTKMGAVRDWVDKHGYFMQTATQGVIDVIAWHAAYDQSIGKGMSEADAVFEADSIIRRTMGDFSPENVSMFETGSAFTRLFTMFASYFNGQANLIGGEMQTVMRTMGWAGAPRMFHVYLMGVAIPAIVGEMIVQAAKGDLFDDDDDDGYLDEIAELFFGSQAKYMAGMVPVAGQIANAVIARFNSQVYDDGIAVSPIVPAIEKTVSAPFSVADAVFDDGSAKKAVSDSIVALGLVTGVPTNWLAKSAGYLAGVAEGTSSPSNVADIARGLVSGRDGSEK